MRHTAVLRIRGTGIIINTSKGDKTMRTRLLSILLAVLFVAGMVTVPAAAADFPLVDVSPEAWYYNDVKTA